jgi:hypothetical protein
VTAEISMNSNAWEREFSRGSFAFRRSLKQKILDILTGSVVPLDITFAVEYFNHATSRICEIDDANSAHEDEYFRRVVTYEDIPELGLFDK